MIVSGNMIVCVNPFFVFEKGHKYYCSHVEGGYFFIHNKSKYNVSYIKVPLSLSKNFKITR